MNAFERLLAKVDFLRLKPEDAIELGRPGYFPRSYIPVPTANAGQALSFGQLTLAFSQSLLGALAFGNALFQFCGMSLTWLERRRILNGTCCLRGKAFCQANVL